MKGQFSTNRFSLRFQPETHQKIVAGTGVALHCHHYNSRIQRTIEGAADIDGKALFVRSAESVFAGMFNNILSSEDRQVDRLRIIGELYAYLGYGLLDFSRWTEEIITAPVSHFVEGWMASFHGNHSPVCSMTEGYLQAAIHAVTGESVHVHENHCMVRDAEVCRFSVQHERLDSVIPLDVPEGIYPAPTDRHYLHSQNVDEQAIVDALAAMPLLGDEEGLIPAFNVYLANIPVDFYNLVCFRFVEEMEKVNLGNAARAQLIHDAENCGMNTFRGIMSSKEWRTLVDPMLNQEGDALYAIIAVSNALGWGNWHVLAHTPGESLHLQSLNGYEANGYLARRSLATQPVCLMLTGVAAGVMELIYGEGLVRERFGQFHSVEKTCRCCGLESCTFMVEET